MQHTDAMLPSTYDFRLVGLSFLIAVTASYTALALAGRVKSGSGQTRYRWLFLGGVTMGTGIWSMHFIAMLAFNLPHPVTYDALTTLVSWIDAIIASGMALLLASRSTLGLFRLLSGSVFMGLAIASMHYVGMAAMQVQQVRLQYDYAIAGLSVAIAICASLGALWLTFRLRNRTGAILNLCKLGSALLMGIGISGMHYTGIAAASFIECEEAGAAGAYALDLNLLASVLGGATLIILILTLIAALFDQRLVAMGESSEALKESEKHVRILIREMQIGVLLLNPNLEIIVSNQAAIDLLNLTDSQWHGQAALSEDLLFFQENGTPFAQDSWPMQQAIATRKPIHNVVMGAYHLCGSQLVWLQVDADPQLADDGSVERIVCTFINITPRKLAEAALRQSEAREREKATQLGVALKELRETQAQLIQTEKMSSLGQLVAGVAHEINNPVNFIYGNLSYASKYTLDLLSLVHLYSQHYPNPIPEIQAHCEAIDLEFLSEDLPKLLDSMKVGAERILQIVLTLKNFSRHDEAAMKPVNIHSGIDSTLLILQNQLKGTGEYQTIEVVKEYGHLPMVECYAGQLNQVFMNIISNAIDALDEVRKQKLHSNAIVRSPQIWIRTSYSSDRHHDEQILKNEEPITGSVMIQIGDNGSGMAEAIKARLFDPFFTTKAVGKGTGLGLSISYRIVVEKHRGSLECFSQPGQGTEFAIKIPVRPTSEQLPEHSLLNELNYSPIDDFKFLLDPVLFN